MNMNRTCPVSISGNKDLSLLKMPKRYRRYMKPEEQSVIRKDLLKLSKEDDPQDRENLSKFKRARLKIDDIKDRGVYQSERYHDEANSAHFATQSASVILIKNFDKYTLIFPNQKLECHIAQENEVIKRRLEHMDQKLDARRKQNDYEQITQTKNKGVHELPQMLQEEEEESDSAMQQVPSKERKKKLKKLKNQHRLQVSDSESQPNKKVKKNGELSSASEPISDSPDEVSVSR